MNNILSSCILTIIEVDTVWTKAVSYTWNFNKVYNHRFVEHRITFDWLNFHYAKHGYNILNQVNLILNCSVISKDLNNLSFVSPIFA